MFPQELVQPYSFVRSCCGPNFETRRAEESEPSGPAVEQNNSRYSMTIYGCIYVYCMYMYIYIYIHVYMYYVCMYIYIYTWYVLYML